MQNTILLDPFDGLLSQHPFGKSDYVIQQLHVCYKRRLRKISAHLPAAGQLLAALNRVDAYQQYRTIGDTVVRCAVQHALSQVETGAQYGLPLEQCNDVFRATVRLLEEGTCGPLGFGLAHRLGSEPHYGWVWSGERAEDVFVRSFIHVVQDNYGETKLCTLETDELAMLVKGAQLLDELLPRSSRSALSHAHLVAIFAPVGNWATTGSSSYIGLSGTFFLSRASLASPWWVAEQLFHEALHQQMYDFRQGHSLLVPTYGDEEGPQVCSLWNLPNSNKSNYWNTDRVLAAFHVYVHLALLCTLAEQRATELSAVYGPLVRMTRSRDALGRAHYLAEQLRAACWQELGLAGRQFVDWFSSVLDALDPSPPPKGSYVHLLFDRYRREARKIDRLLSKGECHPDLSRRLEMLVKDEIATARCLLVTINADADLARFNDGLAQFSDDDLWTRFAQVRELISTAIMDASPDGYGWIHQPGPPDEMVKRMIESSSEILIPLFAKDAKSSTGHRTSPETNPTPGA